MFQNDDVIIDFLELQDNISSGDHKARFSIELDSATYFKENAKTFSCKKITIHNGYSSENRTMTLLDPKAVKIKDVSNDENLLEVPKDGKFDILPFNTNKKRSSILVEETKEINLGITNNPHMIHLSASLTPKKDPSSAKFFQQRQIKFAWSYSDMSGLDIDLVMHHLTVAKGVKPVKQKLRKIHPHITLLVKV